MQAIVTQISGLFLSYNDYLSKNLNSPPLDKKTLDTLLDAFLNQTVPNTNTKTKTRTKTCYQNFFAMKRKLLSEQNPDLAFGAISKMISTEWRSMSKTDKDAFKTINISEDTNNADEKSNNETKNNNNNNSTIVFPVSSTHHKKLNEPMDASIERYFIENSDNDESDGDDNDDHGYEEEEEEMEGSQFVHNNDIEDDDDRGNDDDDDDDDQTIDKDDDDEDEDDDDDLDSLNFSFDDD